MGSQPRGSLEARYPQAVTSEFELFLMRRAAWRQQGIAVVSPGDIVDDIERQVLVNLATRLYGPR